MAFTDPFIRRPVLASVVSLLIVLLGMQAFSKLVIREYPQMENALITVTTLYAGANAETIQGYITQPLQQSLASAEGIDYMTSVSRQNYSTISIYARIGANTDRLVTELLAKSNEVKSQLPPDAEDPVLQKEAADASALMYISFYSEQMNNPQITDYLSRVIQPKLATLPGIAGAEILGNQVFAMRLWLDPVKMAAFGVTAGEINQAVQQHNFLAAAGEVKGQVVVTRVNASTDLKSPQAFAAIPVKTDGDRRVLMGDVARVELGAASYDAISSFNGIPSVYIGIKGTPSANPLDVIKEVRAKMPELEEQLPPNLKVSIAYDATRFIQASIDEVVKTLGADAGLRLQRQPADPAGDGPGHRPGGGRRDRGGGKHPPPHRGGQAALRGRPGGRAGDRRAGGQHDHHPRRGLRADRFPHRPHRRPVQGVRLHPGRRGDHFRDRRA